MKSMIAGLLSRLAGVQTGRGLWIDGADAERTLARMDVSETVRTALFDLITRGVACLKANVHPNLIDEVLKDFARYCRASEVSADYRDEFGLHERLCNLQLESTAARRIALNSTTIEVLTRAFGKEPVVVGSLLFEKGSQQSVHRDGPAFFTWPTGQFFGVWNALEDIAPDAGPLIYYEGGHRAISDKDLRRAGAANEATYFRRVIEDCEKRHLVMREVLLQRGDTLIWHSQLPHGGSKISNPARSRKSLVFHYIPLGTPIFGPTEFFGPGAPKARGPNYSVLELDGGKFLNQGSPRFFHNYVEGNFHEV